MRVFDEVPDLGSVDDIGRYLADNGWTPAQVFVAVEHLKVTWLNEAKFENTDNLRLARLDDADELSDYQGAVEEGCCDEYDVVLDTLDGRITVGFNHGH
jgi:hypothetical protein